MNKENKRQKFMKKTRESVQEAFKSRDMVLAGVTKAIEELDRVANVLMERLEDWYGIYLPELRLEDKQKYAELVLYVDKNAFDKKEIASIAGQKKADEIENYITKSMGAQLNENDLKEVKLFAQRVLDIYKIRAHYEQYLQELCKEICPNMAEVGGSDVASKLVAHVGSLKRLSVLPASTIQVLGAEKSLFKHLKNRRIAPPKHGIIFQHPKISGSPKAVRGKIARALANKLALAARADGFTKHFIAPQLKKDFEDRYKEIMAEYERAKAKNENTS